MDGLSHVLAQIDSAKPSTSTSRQNHAVHSTLCMAASNPSQGIKLEGEATMMLRHEPVCKAGGTCGQQMDTGVFSIGVPQNANCLFLWFITQRSMKCACSVASGSFSLWPGVQIRKRAVTQTSASPNQTLPSSFPAPTLLPPNPLLPPTLPASIRVTYSCQVWSQYYTCHIVICSSWAFSVILLPAITPPTHPHPPQAVTMSDTLTLPILTTHWHS